MAGNGAYIYVKSHFFLIIQGIRHFWYSSQDVLFSLVNDWFKREERGLGASQSHSGFKDILLGVFGWF